LCEEEQSEKAMDVGPFFGGAFGGFRLQLANAGECTLAISGTNGCCPNGAGGFGTTDPGGGSAFLGGKRVGHPGNASSSGVTDDDGVSSAHGDAATLGASAHVNTQTLQPGAFCARRDCS